MFHAFSIDDLGRQNVPTTLNQTMVPSVLLNDMVQHLEPGECKEGLAYCLWEKDCFEAFLQRHSLCKFGVTRISVTSFRRCPNIHRSPTLQFFPFLTLAICISASTCYIAVPADLWAVLVTSCTWEQCSCWMHSLLTMSELIEVSTHRTDEVSDHWLLSCLALPYIWPLLIRHNMIVTHDVMQYNYKTGCREINRTFCR